VKLYSSWWPTQYKIGEAFKQCVAREKALAEQREEADNKPPPGIQPTFAPNPPPAPTAPTPTPQAAPKIYMQERQLLIAGPTPEMNVEPVFAANETLFEYSCVDSIEFTAPLNDTITMPAETPQEASKIQNKPATQERVPERVNDQTTGIDQTLANTNIINQAGEGVATETVANEQLKQKPPVTQQRVPKNEKKRDNTLPIAVVGVAAAVGAAVYMTSS
jgi:hypothetical protein